MRETGVVAGRRHAVVGAQGFVAARQIGLGVAIEVAERRRQAVAAMLLGDAAHPCTPNLGLGGCMALEDALVLAKSFAKESSPELALRRYESLRRERTRHVQQRSLLMGHIGQWENLLIAAGRQVVTGMLPAKIFERNLRRIYSYAA